MARRADGLHHFEDELAHALLIGAQLGYLLEGIDCRPQWIFLAGGRMMRQDDKTVMSLTQPTENMESRP